MPGHRPAPYPKPKQSPRPGSPNAGPLRPRSEIQHLTYPVYCHCCPVDPDATDRLHRGRIPRYRARAIGSARFGALWHCAEHQHGDHPDCRCPFGDWTDEPIEEA